MAHGALLLVSITFSAWNVMAESLDAEGFQQLIVCAIRDCTAGLVVWAVGLCHHGRAAWFLRPTSDATGTLDSRRDTVLVAAAGLSGMYASPLLCLLTVAWAGDTTAGIFSALSPAFASALAVLSRLEQGSLRLAFGVALGVGAGLVAMLGTTPSSGGGHAGFGILTGFLSALGTSLFFIALKPLLMPSDRRLGLDVASVVALAYAFASAASTATCLLAIATCGVRQVLGPWAWKQTLLSMYAGIVCGALNYSLLAFAQRRLSVTACALYGALQPPFTALIAFVARQEVLRFYGFVAIALAVASLVVVAWEPAEEWRQDGKSLLMAHDEKPDTKSFQEAQVSPASHAQA